MIGGNFITNLFDYSRAKIDPKVNLVLLDVFNNIILENIA